MSKQTPVQSSSFSIRFKPASAMDQRDDLGCADDVCGIDDRSLSDNGSCEAVLFERVPNTEELASPIDFADGRPVTHPGNLWKNSQGTLSHSAPVSELTSPTLPSALNPSPVTQEKPSVVKPLAGSQPIAEKLSIFSGLMEKLDKLSTESKEIFDRKMKRSGSADGAKITSLLSDPGVTKLNAAVKNESTSENNEYVARSSDIGQIEEVTSEVTEQLSERDSSVSSPGSSYIHKSTSSIEVTKADILQTSAKQKRASLGGECGQEPVVMSRLLSVSATSQSDDKQTLAAEANISQNVSKETQHATDAQHVKKPKRLLPSARFRYLLSFLIVVVACVVIPMPTYVSGMVFGAFLATVSILFYQRLTRSPSQQATTVFSPNVRSSMSVTAEVRESKNVEGKFQVRKTLQNVMSACAVVE